MYRVGQLGAHGLSTVWNQEVSARGRLAYNTSCIVFSNRVIASVHYREVHSWEGPLWEHCITVHLFPLLAVLSLYNYTTDTHIFLQGTFQFRHSPLQLFHLIIRLCSNAMIPNRAWKCDLISIRVFIQIHHLKRKSILQH